MEPMESFLQLSGVTIQKITSDPGREEKESPKQVERSEDSESSDDESVERQDESDCKGDVESDADLSEREEDDLEEPEESNVTKDEALDAEAAVVKTEPDVKVENEGAEEDKELEVKPSSGEAKTETPSKRKKRKKNDPERECVRKKKRKKRSNKEPKVETDSDEEKEQERNKRMKNLRKNIREVMNENELDEETKAAQREEMERLMRVQEQQKMLKEMQRQILLDRQKTLFQSLGQSPSLYRNCTITPMTLNKDAASQQPSSSAGAQDDARYPDCGTTPGGCFSTGHIQFIINHCFYATGASVTLVQKSKEESPGASEPIRRSLDQQDSMPDISSLCPAPKGANLVVIMDFFTPLCLASELVTISSSDDDCMIVSGGSEAESEPEDPTNSGLHTNDVFNIPDAQGQVLINVGHPKNEPDIFLAPQV
jgi:RAD54-like protein 2